MTRATALLLALAGTTLAAPVPKAKGPLIDVRDPDGKVLLAAEDLVSYDWAAHTMTLKDGAKGAFAEALAAAEKFAVCVDGKPVMEGRFVPPTVGSIRKGPVITLPDSRKGAEHQVTIHGGYPGIILGDEDKREVKELKEALEKAGKLKTDK